jgi:cytochrome c
MPERAVRTLAAVLLIGAAVTSSACERTEAVEDVRQLTGGEPSRGAAAIGRYGCGGCHEIPGIRNARGTVGPPLTGIAGRTYLAGRVANSPAGMVQWIQHPQRVEPGTAMPEMQVTDQDARDITAYLYLLR